MSEPKYEYSAALREPDGTFTPVGVQYAEDVYGDASVRVRDEFHAWHSYEEYRDRVVTIRRPLGAWEAVGE